MIRIQYGIIYVLVSVDNTIPVAFTAYISESRVYDNQDIVIFDAIETNIGNHFQLATNTFLCPYDGLYAFQISLLTDNTRVMHVALMLETRSVSFVYGNSAHYHQGTNLVIIECSSAERVWVMSVGNNQGVCGNEYNHHSSFSGFLLHKY